MCTRTIDHNSQYNCLPSEEQVQENPENNTKDKSKEAKVIEKV